MRLQPGVIIGGRYTLIEEIGAGGFGTVWRAVDRQGTFAAVKFLKPDLGGETALRFVREADILSRLRHENCVAFFEFEPGDDQRWTWLATEYIDGQPLDEWISHARTLAENIEVSVQITRALGAAHRAGVLHRDLKPANILISERAGRLHVTVLDFGIGKLLEQRRGDITTTGEVIGTPGFMSPEQLRGLSAAGPASDLYCLGAVMFAIFEVRPVFDGESALEVSMKHLIEPPPPMSAQVPSRIRELVMRMLAKAPEDRPAAAEAVLAVLRPTTAAPQTARASSWRAVGALAIVLLVAVGAAIAIFGRSKEPERPRVVLRPVVSKPARVDTQPEDPPDPTPRDRPAVLPSIGCSGVAIGARPDGVVRVPSGRKLMEPAPVIVLLAEKQQDGAGIIAETKFGPLADEKGFIVAAPDRPTKENGRAVLDFVAALGEHECIDENRVYALGHGNGSDILDTLRASSTFAAVVATSHRLRPWQLSARPKVRRPGLVPYLLLTPRDDRLDPIEGGASDMSLAEHLQRLRAEHGCDNEPTALGEVAGGACTTWSCPVELRSCEIEGGRHWPGYKPTEKGEVGKPSRFQHQEYVWEFLSRHRRTTLASKPCEIAWPAGRHTLVDDMFEVPKGYQPGKAHPVVIVLHEDLRDPGDMLTEVGLRKLADAQQFLVYAPAGPHIRKERGSNASRENTWGEWDASVVLDETPGTHTFDIALETMKDWLCIDEERIYVVGHGNSGLFAERLRGDSRIAAVSTFSHRPTWPHVRGRNARSAAPYLFIAPLDDSNDPIEGGDVQLSLGAYEEALRGEHGCSGSSTPHNEPSAGSTCRAWTDCREELVTCRIRGGRHWPGVNDDVGDFKHRRVLWEFLARHRRSEAGEE